MKIQWLPNAGPNKIGKVLQPDGANGVTVTNAPWRYCKALFTLDIKELCLVDASMLEIIG